MKSWIWAKWNCNKCKSLLQFNKMRRLCVAGGIGLSIFASSFLIIITHDYLPISNFLLSIVVLAALLFPICLIDGVELAESEIQL